MTMTTQVILVLALLAGFSAYWWQTGQDNAVAGIPADNTASVQEPLPEFSLPDLTGQTRHSHEWSGDILVVNFWATWCPPCLKEIPIFMKMQENYGEQGLQFVGVALDDIEQVKIFAKRMQINYPNLVGERAAMQLSSQLGNRLGALPYTVIVNRAGKIVYKHPGDLTEAELNQLLLPLLETPKAVEPPSQTGLTTT